jgi:hypothetical protein
MSVPQIIDYNEAVQDPRHAFTDAELRNGTVAVTPLGLPLALSGGFALTYTVRSGSNKFAVRCFHREVPEAQKRYAAISTKLRSLAAPYFVRFDFQAAGIRVQGHDYPIVKMDWVEGETLGEHLDRISGNPASLGSLRKSFALLAEYLEQNRIGHGDIQNENVMVARGGLRFIDYDGMYVAGLPEGHGTEIGHKHFQHTQRRPEHFGPHMDRFSFIVLDVSLEALQADATLHKRFREGGQAIIFKANDFADPAGSEIFRLLSGIAALRVSAAKLAAICNGSIASVPSLADFVAGRNIPAPAVRPIKSQPPQKIERAYIGPFPVLDASDFQAVMSHIGDKVELVGRIVTVKQGTGKRGRGRGRPYVFLNFGPWNQESVKITIWSEGLSQMTTRPDESWTGRWISVTGLVEPPYVGKHYGRSYHNVGVTVSSNNQIVFITEKESAFRRGHGRPQGTLRSGGNGRGKQSNVDILNTIRRRQGAPTASPISQLGSLRPPQHKQNRPGTSPPTASPNQRILQQIKQSTASTGGSTWSSPPTPRPQPTPGVFSRIPLWAWIAAGIVLWILLRR